MLSKFFLTFFQGFSIMEKGGIDFEVSKFYDSCVYIFGDIAWVFCCPGSFAGNGDDRIFCSS